jgi:lactoylglutathione lyase
MTAPPVTLNFFKLVVKDMPAMLDFYERAFGFTVSREIDSPVMEEAILTLPGSDGRFSLVLYHWKDGRKITVGNGHGPVGLHTADVDAAFSHAVAQGAAIAVKPFAFPGARIAFVLDPEGHEIELINMEAAA